MVGSGTAALMRPGSDMVANDRNPIATDRATAPNNRF